MNSTTNATNKKHIWSIVLTILELILVVFLLMVSIVAMVTVGHATGFIKWLQIHTLWFFFLIVFPLIVIFLFNIYLLIKNLNDDKTSLTTRKTHDELLAEAKKQAREELMAEIERQKKEAENKK